MGNNAADSDITPHMVFPERLLSSELGISPDHFLVWPTPPNPNKAHPKINLGVGGEHFDGKQMWVNKLDSASALSHFLGSQREAKAHSAWH